MSVMVVMFRGVNFGQYMHQSDVEQGTNSDKKNKSNPEVNCLPFRIISANISGSTRTLLVEDDKG